MLKNRVHVWSNMLTVDFSPDKNSLSERIIYILISNTGMPVMSSSAEVFVTISNINDNGPVFGQGSYSVSLKDNTTLGTMVLQVNASDADSPELMFSILSGNTDNAFSISAQSGTAPCWLFVFVVNLY